jgi:hypothetical protein
VALVGFAALACGKGGDETGAPATAGASGGDVSARRGDAGALGSDAGNPRDDADAPPPVRVAGRWGMREKWSDQIAADLIQNGDVLSGTLCSAGLPVDPSDPAQSLCAPLAGRVDGRHVRFSSRILTELVTIDAEASADGSRIGGGYSVDGRSDSTAWSRLADGASWVDPNENWPPDLLPWSCDDPAYNPGYELTLVHVNDPTASGEFTTDRTYLMVFCAGIAGDLGAFGGAELQVATVGGRTTTIIAGPVPETAPTLPTTLTLHFEHSLLVTVDARTPSGATYSFRAEHSPGGTL